MPTGDLEIATDLSRPGRPFSCQYSLTEEHANRSLSVESHPSPKGESDLLGGMVLQGCTRSCQCLLIFLYASLSAPLCVCVSSAERYVHLLIMFVTLE